jgi:hypothetical protein
MPDFPIEIIGTPILVGSLIQFSKSNRPWPAGLPGYTPVKITPAFSVERVTYNIVNREKQGENGGIIYLAP